MALLEVTDLKTSFRTDDGVVGAVDGVSFSVEKGKTLAIVGESGCGKSVTCMSIMGLYSHRNTTVSGSAVFKDRDLLKLPPDELRKVRGNEISMIFQDPMTSLNPVHTVGQQLAEAVLLHSKTSKAAAKPQAVSHAKAVGIPRADTPRGRLPAPVLGRHAPAGDDRDGADQQPRPADRRRAHHRARRHHPGADPRPDRRGCSASSAAAIILITHDLGVVAEIADDVLVMYAGRRSRRAPYEDIFYHPRHPYTWGLLDSLPRLAIGEATAAPIPGQSAVAPAPARGCRFHSALRVRDGCLPHVAPAAASGGTERLDHRDACHLESEFKSEHAATW